MANTATLHRVSPLSTAHGQRPRKIFESATVTVREVAFLSLLSVRTLPKADGAALLAALLKPLSIDVPAKPCTLSGSEDEYCGWFEPRAWMIVSDSALDVQPQAGALVTDLSDRLAVFDVIGPKARDVIASACDPTLFALGCFTRARFGSLGNVLVSRPQEERYRLMLDVSIADSFAHWLQQTATDIA